MEEIKTKYITAAIELGPGNRRSADGRLKMSGLMSAEGVSTEPTTSVSG
jgi:hypothetical protein